MPNPLNLCFSKLKSSSSSASSSSKTSKRSKPKNPNMNKRPSQNTLLFNSLYNATSDSDTPTTPLRLDISTSANSSSSTSSSPSSSSDGLDLSSIFSSQRFFFSSPGRSNAIVEEAATLLGPGLAVPTYSGDPYADFRRSMEEMVVAQGLDVRSHWDHLHELLLCYLALNRKNTHQFIVGAFSDLLRSLTAGRRESQAATRSCK
ncbi:hypothetical protein AAC387_Pa01g2902 [Persea americana]